MGSIEWPKIPEIPVDFKKVDGDLIAEVKIDLGILGEWETGGLKIDLETLESSSKEELEEMMKDVTEEIQYTFTRFILKLAAVALVKGGEGYAPLLHYYERALGDLTAVVPVEGASPTIL